MSYVAPSTLIPWLKQLSSSKLLSCLHHQPVPLCHCCHLDFSAAIRLIGFSFSFMLSHFFLNSELKEKGMYLSCLTLQMDLSSLISTLPRHYKHMSLDHPKPPLDLSPVQCPGKQSQPACCLSDLVLIEVPQYLSIVFQALRIKWCICCGLQQLRRSKCFVVPH